MNEVHELLHRLEPTVGPYGNGGGLALQGRQDREFVRRMLIVFRGHRERHARSSRQDGVAVGRLVEQRRHCDGAFATRPVLDYKSMAEPLTELLASLTHHHVQRRTRTGPT